MENFLQNELRKILHGTRFDVVYVGDNCAYIIVGNCRIKVLFHDPISAGCYSYIYLKAIHKDHGELDSVKVGIKETIGLKKVANPNYPQGFSPHIYRNRDSGGCQWSVYQPDWKDYEAIRAEIEKFAGLFV